jgi:hypothetical protein
VLEVVEGKGGNSMEETIILAQGGTLEITLGNLQLMAGFLVSRESRRAISDNNPGCREILMGVVVVIDTMILDMPQIRDMVVRFIKDLDLEDMRLIRQGLDLVDMEVTWEEDQLDLQIP